ncbi:MAG TPA: hypothetical protein VHT71_18350 [Methylomirabilota bacterium]|jgi:hypothetical protein|nr:hypothetical protein [Methylomirabilota bacterium]
MTDDSDAFETLYAKGVTDGLPVVAPTAERVAAAIEASGRAADELVGLVAPQHGRATVQRIAINAVMAGCRPEYLPVVIAAVEAICDPAFTLEGVSGTTDAVTPLLIINGPIRAELDVNAAVGVFGPGWRANATIGRAVRLIWANVGGARPGVISMSTFGQPGRYTYCIGEYEEASPWEALHVEHGFAPTDSTVAALAAEAPQVVVDARNRTARDVLTTVARNGEALASHAVGELGDTLLVIGPEHARTIGGDGWSKANVRAFLFEHMHAETDGVRVPKLRGPDALHIVVAGGTAGRFSAWLPGWPFRGSPSRLVIRKIGG